ncbi:MAG: ParB/RepB/Spo0J family partition protein [Bacteroidetes bacterium]|nr:ParB/RepB/Spo0J family partition protein [Bacteroidota bacterium]
MATQKSALGRGLDALLGTDGQLRSEEDARALVGGIFELPIESIHPNPYQPRQEFQAEALESLAQSIEQLGIVQPITVRATKGDQFELISGERRLRAAKLVGLSAIPAYIRPAKNTQMLEMALVENVQRVELNPIEVALGYQRLVNEYHLSQEEVAQRVGKQRPTVTNFLRLLNLPPNIQVGLREGLITTGHARALLSLPDDRSKNKLYSEIQKDQLSVRETERRVQSKTRKPKKPNKKDPSPALHLKEIEGKLRKYLGTKVSIQQMSKASGKIIIEYYTDEDLSRLLDLLHSSK